MILDDIAAAAATAATGVTASDTATAAAAVAAAAFDVAVVAAAPGCISFRATRNCVVTKRNAEAQRGLKERSSYSQ